MTDPTTTAVSRIVELREELGSLDDVTVAETVAVRERASRDEYEMSPVLKATLPATIADLVAQPVSAAAIGATVAAAVRHHVPITPRGRGTGNYGQAVPLAAGLVVDTTRASRILDIGEGWITAEAGARIVDLETRARETGQELNIFPSTMQSSIGGFLAGGSGGSGSVGHGGIEDGFVRELQIAYADGHAELHTVTGDACIGYLHAYGTTGVIATATVTLDPVHDWVAVWSSFDRFPDAQRAVLAASALEPAPRIASADMAELIEAFPRNPSLRPGRAGFRAVVDRSVLGELRAFVAGLGGVVDDESSELRSQYAISMLSYNHPSWHLIRRSEQPYFHIEAGGMAMVERFAEIADAVPGMRMHLDAGRPEPLGMVTVPWVSPEHVEETMATLTSIGVGVHSPHSWFLDRRVELAKARAALTDPLGLLNPGKLP